MDEHPLLQIKVKIANIESLNLFMSVFSRLSEVAKLHLTEDEHKKLEDDFDLAVKGMSSEQIGELS